MTVAATEQIETILSLSFSPFLKRSTTIMEGWPLGTASTFISVSTRWQKKKENRCLPSRQFDYRNKKETVWLIAIERKWRKTKPVIDRFSICPTTRNRNTTTNPMLIFQLIQQQQLGVLFFVSRSNQVGWAHISLFFLEAVFFFIFTTFFVLYISLVLILHCTRRWGSAGWPLCRDRMIRECLLRRDQIGIKWRQNAESAGPSLRFGSWCLSRDISQRPWSRKFTTGSDGSPSWSWRAVKSARRPAGCVSRKGHRPKTQQQQQQPLLLLLQLMPVGGPAFTLERVKLAHLFGPASSINLLSRARANEWIYLKMKNKKNPGHLLPGKEVGPEMEWSTFFQQFWRKCAAAAAAGRTRGLV